MGSKPYLAIEVDEHSSQVGVVTRLEAFIESAKNHLAHVRQLEQASAAAVTTATPHSLRQQGCLTNIAKLDKNLPLAVLELGRYSQLAALYLEGRGYNVVALPATDQRTLKCGHALTRGKETFVTTALLGDVTAMAKGRQLAASSAAEKSGLGRGGAGRDEQSRGEPGMGKARRVEQSRGGSGQAGFQVLVPQSSGAETDGLDALLLHTELLRARQPGITVVGLNVEQASGRPQLANTLYRIALAADIAAVASSNGLIQKISADLRAGLPSDQQLLSWAANAAAEAATGGARPALILGGEYRCLHNALFRQLVVCPLQQAGYRVLDSPLSEMLLFLWSDAPRAQKPDKAERAALAALLCLHRQVVAVLGSHAAFAPSIEQLRRQADQLLGNYLGGFGRYRTARLHSNYAAALNACGIVTAASNYENTQAILDLIVPSPRLPHLRLSFDGETSPLARLRIEAFLEQLQT
jgi:hypothetical protein